MIPNSSRSRLGAALSLLVAAALSLPASAQTYRQDHQSSLQYVGDLAVHADGSAALVGTKLYAGVVVRTDAQGAMTSVRRLETLTGMSVQTSAATFTKSGTLVLAGTAASKAWITGVDPNSMVAQWDHTLSDWFGSLYAVAPTADGGVVAGGRDTDDHLDDEGVVVRIGPSGDLLWRRALKTPSVTPNLQDVAATSDGGVLVSQHGYIGASGFGEYALILTRLDAGGDVAWQKCYGGAGALYQGHATELADGGILVAGVTEVGQSTDNYRFWSVRLDASGNLLGSKRYATYPSDLQNGSVHGMFDIVATSDGGCALLVQQPMPGVLPNGKAEDDTAILRLSSNGDVQWFRSVGETGFDETPMGIARVPSGFLVAGRLWGGGVRLSRVDSEGRIGGDCSAHPDLESFQEDLATVAFDLDEPLPASTSTAPEQHLLATLESGSSNLLCGNFCQLTGGGFGVGLAGTAGLVPQLTANSGYCIGGAASLRLTGAVGGTVGLLGIATQTQAWPILGGWSYLSPVGQFQLVVFTDGAPGAAGGGSFELPLTGNLSGLAGTTIYAQALLYDAAAPQGWSMSACATLLVQ